jgi:predicted MPP superfamily phosphohydrolase
MADIDSNDFVILLSHDPSIWQEKVKEKTNIALTLSGHTHGLQLGINNRWLKWSPSQYIYSNWLGQYIYNEQILYVNAGFGYIGIPMRIGILPEVGLLTLHKKTN